MSLTTLFALLIACGSGCAAPTGDSSGEVSDRAPMERDRAAVKLKSIAVTPTPSSLYANVSQALTATGTYSDGSTQNLTSTATWTTSNASVAAVSAAGVVTTIAPGTATISAVSGTITGKATVKVLVTLTSIAVTPPSPSIPANTTQALVATGMYDSTTTKNLTSTVTWMSSNPSVATVSSAGLVLAVAPGTTTITASTSVGAESLVAGSAILTVTTATLTSVSVTPATKKIPALGTAFLFKAMGLFSDGTKLPLAANVTWASSNAAVATISSDGTATSVAAGTVALTATALGIQGKATLTVGTATLSSVTVTPVTLTLPIGLTESFVATGTYSDGSTMDLTTTATWASATTGVATVSNVVGSQGQVTTVSAGTAKISATVSGKKGTATLTVSSATLASIAITPASPHVPIITTQQLTATGTYSDHTTQNLTSLVVWTSSADAVVAVSNAPGTAGLAYATTVGTSTITATDPTTGIASMTTFTATSAVLRSLVITPSSATITPGFQEQFTATGTYSDASTANLTASVVWSTGSASVATISNDPASSGLAMAAGVGSTSIGASLGGIIVSATLNVTAAHLASLAITPGNPSIANGLTQQFAATGSYSDGSQRVLTQAVTWSVTSGTAMISSAPGSSGLATSDGVGASTVQVVEPVSGVTATTTLTVTPAALVSIGVSPSSVTLSVGGTQQFAATGTYTDGTTQIVTAAVGWTSSAPNVTISSTGFANAVLAGSVNITATDPATGIQGTATVNPMFTLGASGDLAGPSGSVGFAVGDFNGDGLADVAVADLYGNAVKILLGTGQGTFTLAASSPIPLTAPTSVAAGDFNGDGVLDLAIPLNASPVVAVLLGVGQGGFIPAAGSPFAVPVRSATEGASFVAVRDMNNDGLLDLLTANFFDSTISVLLGNGHGSFSGASGSPVPVGAYPIQVALADFNGDGNVDTASVNQVDDTVTVLLGDGHGGLAFASTAPIGNQPNSIGAGDFNGDGIPDLVTNSTNSFGVPTPPGGNTVTVLLGNGAGGFAPTAGSPFPAGTGLGQIQVADFNRDGFLDVALDSTTSAAVLLGNGQGFLAPAPGSPFGVGETASALAVGDFNADGSLDLVVGNTWGATISVLVNTTIAPVPLLVPAPDSPIASGNAPAAIAVGDFNGDGNADMAVAYESSLGVTDIFLGDGHGNFSVAPGSPIALAAVDIATGDFNGDGVLDLVGADFFSATVEVMLGDGHDGFTPAAGSPFTVPTLNPGAGPYFVAVGDMNKDGVSDLVTANYGDNTVSVLLGNGEGSFAGATGSPISVGALPLQIALGDFNGDGNLDAASANQFGNSDTILLGDGHGGLAVATTLTFGGQANSLTATDLNGDGKLDLVTSAYDNTINVALGNGLGGFAPGPGSPFSVGPGPIWVRSADFNLDGHPDVAACTNTNAVVMLGNGQGGLAAAPGSPYPVGGSPYTLAIGDFDNDGGPDLVTANIEANNLGVLLNTTPTPTAPLILFGGGNTTTSYSDMWQWNGINWTQLSPSPSPSGRVEAATATLNGVFMFGGYDNGLLGDSWLWSGTSWKQLSPARSPSPRSGSATATLHGNVVLLGGGVTGGDLADTWQWDGVNWTQLSPASSPPVRFVASAATLNGKVVLFGGSSSGTLLGDTWQWDGTNWTQLSPASSPPARDTAAIATLNGKVVLFGGNGAGGVLGDTWQWDGTNWTQMFPATSPSPRAFGVAATINGTVVLFGGETGSSTALGDTWQWDGANWTQLSPATSPPPRWAASLTAL